MRQVISKTSMDSHENIENSESNEPIKDMVYEVEQIVDMEVRSKRKCPILFRVRWVGFTEKDDSLLSLNDLHCSELISEFLEISGRKHEYERALEAKQKELDNIPNLRQRVRSSFVSYSELDEDEEEILPSGTRTRNKRIGGFEDRSSPAVAKSTVKRKKIAKVASPPAPDDGQEYEVERILDHRFSRGKKDYLIRWKGFTSDHDSWVSSENLQCSRMVETYEKYLVTSQADSEKCDFEAEAVLDMREKNGETQYRVKWKGLSSKKDSWVTESVLRDQKVFKRFLTALDKLEKQEDWQVERILKSRICNGKSEYLIRWKGFKPEHDTWEPAENLVGCDKILSQFLARKGKRLARNHNHSKGDSESVDGNGSSSDAAEVTDRRRSSRTSSSQVPGIYAEEV